MTDAVRGLPLVADPGLDGLDLTWEKTQVWLATVGLRILIILLLAAISLWLLRRLINRVVATMTSRSAQRLAESGPAGKVLATATGLAGERQRQRVETVGSLLRSITTVVIITLAGLTIMTLLEIPIAPLLASAGVAGVALGFGAQSLVKDFLSGIFMIFEDQYGVGDVIDTGEAVGTVEEVTLRITRLRDANGVTWYVRNGEIIRVGNRSQGFATAIVDMPVSYSESVERVVGVLREAATAMGADPVWADKFVEEPEVLGVESIVGYDDDDPHRRPVRARRELRRAARDARAPQGRPRRRRRQGSTTRPVRRTGGRSPVTLYDDVGGAPTFEALVHAFYEGVAADPQLRALYPEEDLAPAERRLRMFLTQYFGGPNTYSEERGHPRLRMRHAPYPVTLDMRDRWMRHMLAAMDTLDLPPAQDEQMRDYFLRAAHMLVNTDETHPAPTSPLRPLPEA